ncbi:MAG: Rrf2 family transcriptional regulator [Nitrospinota bacterium]|nr:Rrf2 family transcriptional regulator [Nitrospinota bacterium]
MRISTKGHYAVQAMVDMTICQKEAPVPLGMIAERQGLSQNYLEQLFVKLRKANLVKSVRGPGGGYYLAKSPADITIGDIFTAVDESLIITECADEKSLLEKPCSKSKDCVTQALWAKLCQHFNDLLFSISIEDVVEGRVDLEGRFSERAVRGQTG